MAYSITKTNDYELFHELKRTGDPKLREKLIDKYLYIARILSKRFVNRGIDYDDIYQVAVMGVIYSVDRFDPDRGVCFSTFATPTVLGEIRKYFRDKGSFIKVPRKLCSVFYRAERLRYSENDGEMTMGELAGKLGVTESELDKAYSAGGAEFIKSLEYEANTDGVLSISNIVGVEDNSFLMIEDKDFIKSALEHLSDRERSVIEKRYYKGYSQQKTAESEGVSQMQISRTEKKALKKIRDLYFHE